MSAKPVLNIFAHKQQLAVKLAQDFAGLAGELARSKEQVNIALSGGSTPTLFFKAMADLGPEIDWKKIRLYWVDERCVPPGHPESNFGAAKREFLQPLDIPEDTWSRIRGEDDPGKEAARYGDLIMKNVTPDKSFPVFDIIFLGLGTDGHTASIFPYQKELWNAEQLCTVGIHPETGQKRVTFTGQLINAARKIVFLVTGREKSQVAWDVIRRSGQWENYPASLVAPVRGELEWYMDRDAAGSLK